MKFELQINPQQLQAINLFASGDETRSNLCGIFCEYNGPTQTLTATDGRRLISVEVQGVAQGTGSFIIPSQLITALPSEARDCILRYDQETTARPISYDLGYPHRGVLLSSSEVHGNYPDWRKVLPDQMPVTMPQDLIVNRDFFIEAVDALHALDVPQPGIAITKWNDREMSPIIIKSKNVTILIMPMWVDWKQTE